MRPSRSAGGVLLALALCCPRGWCAALQDPGSGPQAADLELDGVFVDPDRVELAFRCAADPGPLHLAELHPAGPVERGALLVRLAAPELERRIADLELSLRQHELRGRLHTAEARLRDPEQALARWTAERNIAGAEHALRLLTEIEIPQQLWLSEQRGRDAGNLAAEAEEMFQVVLRMYEADEVLETNESLDLAMRRRRLDRRERSRSWIEPRHRILRDQTLPWRLDEARREVHRARHAHALLLTRQAAQVQQERLKGQQQARELEELQRRLLHLREARESLSLVAPRRGVCAPAVEGPRSPDGTEPAPRVSPGQVLVRVLSPAPRWVRATAPESLLPRLEVGQGALLLPNAAATLILPARVHRVDPVVREGRVTVWLHSRVGHARLTPGCTCRVRLLPGS